MLDFQIFDQKVRKKSFCLSFELLTPETLQTVVFSLKRNFGGKTLINKKWDHLGWSDQYKIFTVCFWG